ATPLSRPGHIMGDHPARIKAATAAGATTGRCLSAPVARKRWPDCRDRDLGAENMSRDHNGREIAWNERLMALGARRSRPRPRVRHLARLVLVGEHLGQVLRLEPLGQARLELRDPAASTALCEAQGVVVAGAQLVMELRERLPDGGLGLTRLLAE